MNIVINCVGWASEMRGVDRYCYELVKALLETDRTNRYIVFIGSWQKYFTKLGRYTNLEIVRIRWSHLRLLRNLWHAFIFPVLAKSFEPDVIHLPNTLPLFLKVAPTVCTIHDLLEYVYPETFGFFQTRMRKVIVRNETKLADIVITVSDLAGKSLVDILNTPRSKIRVIYSGVDSGLFHRTRRAHKLAKRMFHIAKDYILFVGILERKKNIDGLIKAYWGLPDRLRNRYQLVIAGKFDNAYGSALELVRRFHLEKDVLFCGQVSDGLSELYQEASLFVLPSFYEGFGLPVLEAMASGVPVVVSKNVAIAQHLRGCCEIFDPVDQEALTQKIALLLRNRRLREKYSREGLTRVRIFDWQHSAAETLNVYNECSKGL